jgi:tripartite-type tricarboxylate transporter receptor subunit TctC
MMKHTQKIVIIALTVSILAVFATSTIAADYPKKPVTMYVVFSPGGSMDSSARGLSAGAEQILGQPIVIVTKDGGGGTVGLGILANDKPDGYTIAAATSTGILRVPLRRKVPYKPLASFTPLFAYAAVASATVVNPDSPFKSMKDLVEYARKNPGKVKYGTAGAGSPMHLVMEVIAMKENIKWIHIPFKGSAAAETALLGGHLDAVSTGDMDKAITGQLRPLCVQTRERMDVLPDVPTTLELGYNYYNDTLFAVYGPAGMDPQIVKTLEDAFEKAVDMPPFKKVAKQFGLVPVKMKSAEYTAFLEKSWPEQVEILTKLKLIEKPATEPR